MGENIMENGSKMICKDLVSTTGQMVENMRDNIITIRNAVMDSIIGVMDVFLKDGGIETNSMVLDNT